MSHLLASPSLSGRTLSIADQDGQAIIVSIGEDGLLSQEALTTVSRDGEGNLLKLVEVDHPTPGEPTLQYFVFPEMKGVPASVREFAVEVNGRLAVPTRYVRGTHVEKEAVEIDEDLEEVILAHPATRGLIRRVDDDAEEGSENVSEASEEEEETEDQE